MVRPDFHGLGVCPRRGADRRLCVFSEFMASAQPDTRSTGDTPCSQNALGSAGRPFVVSDLAIESTEAKLSDCDPIHGLPHCPGRHRPLPAEAYGTDL